MPAGHDLPGCPLHPNSPGDRSVHRIHRVLYAALLVAILVLAAPIAAEAAGPQTLSGVIDSLRLWVVGLLAGLATLFLTIGGIRYMTAGGDPGQIERAKSALRSAAIGYALAALSPVLVAILQAIVGS
jgi:succinate dehydrogenase/fumarate reductase cytochrome b subunit